MSQILQIVIFHEGKRVTLRPEDDVRKEERIRLVGILNKKFNPDDSYLEFMHELIDEIIG